MNKPKGFNLTIPWYVLRWLRYALLDLNFKDEAVYASVTALLMKSECLLAIGAILAAKLLNFLSEKTLAK